ncbi:TRAP transporter large permease [Amorphus orientalis]|uniref:TRAP transporter large permease protein n=1 Tax=Amorphus orientalis TaxID=649198 RepID=A0AAE3VMJ0_9HYPH|nr:TRAP transporter large permease subunit [Amorphus orientalis]MDQ0314485.1 tripartite ATP-independent transporter DctM subunit [Amorphus orientalis]
MSGIGWEVMLGLMGGSLVFLMGIGVPVAFAFLALNLAGAYLILGGESGLRLLALSTTEAVTSFALVPIPLFILMGEVLLHTGLATRAIHAIERLITGVPGRLSLVAVVSGGVFASLSGSSIANTAVLGRVLLPDMLRLGYHPMLSVGPILGIGGVAMLIPPSALAVLFGSLAGISISRLLLAGIVPGLLLATLFFLFIVTISRMRPALAPAQSAEREPLGARLRPFLINVVPLMAIVVVVVGSILGGYATPTESAALGSIATVIAAAAYRSLSWTAIRKALAGTAATTAMIFIIISGSITFSQILSFSGATRQLVALVVDLDIDIGTLVLMMLLVALLLGMLMDQISIMLITLPFFMPLIGMSDVDPIWFGVLMLIALEVGLITPPFGLLLFIMKSVAPDDVTMRQILVSIVPYIGIELLGLAVIFIFPILALWLPGFL